MAAKKGTIRQIKLVREGQTVTFDLEHGTVHNPIQQGGEGGLNLSGPADGDGIEINLETMILWGDITIEFDPAPDDAPIAVRRYAVDG